MIRVFRDSYKLSLLIGTLFLFSILVSAYFLYSVPHSLMVNATDGSLVEAYLSVTLSFLLGAGALYLALQSQREIVVYKERSLADSIAAANATEESGTTMTLEGIKSSISQSRGEKDLLKAFIQTICKELDAGQGALYLVAENKIELKSGYALNFGENTTVTFDFGEGLIGQCASNQKTLYIDDVPDGYIKIISGLGSASPRYLLVVPIIKDQALRGVVEIASFKALSEDQRKYAEESTQLLASKL